MSKTYTILFKIHDNKQIIPIQASSDRMFAEIILKFYQKIGYNGKKDFH